MDFTEVIEGYAESYFTFMKHALYLWGVISEWCLCERSDAAVHMISIAAKE